MRTLLTYLRNKHPNVFRYFLILLCILFITYLLPKERKFKYEYIKGKPWLHEDLIAPFDFAVNKSDAELKKDRIEVVKTFTPFYRLNPDVPKKKIEGAIKILHNSAKKFNYNLTSDKIKKHETAITHALTEIYNKGVFLVYIDHEKFSSDSKINVLVNNVVDERNLSDFFNLQYAQIYFKNFLDTATNISAETKKQLLQIAVDYNVFYDPEISQKYKQQFLDQISLTRGMVQKEEIIISKGNIVDDKTYLVLESLRIEYTRQIGNNYFVTIGQLILVAVVFLILVIFMLFFRHNVFSDNRKVVLILLLIVFMIYLVTWALETGLPSIYILPFCIVPIIISILFDTRLALFIHLLIILISSFLVPNSYEFAFIQISTGIVAIFSIVNIRKRGQFIISAGLILLTYSTTYLGISLIHEGSILTINWQNLYWFLISTLLTLTAYLLIYVIEKVFGFTTEITFMELADTNNPLLKELSLKAPGTFHHSLQVANLAEAAVYEIEGNSTLIRAGALYHDIGKMYMPAYFIENLSGESNPHDELSYEESARIIIDHVISGIELAKKHKLPEDIIDFIRTHHGTTRVEYFYREYIKNMPEEGTMQSDQEFCYPGPLPFSKETAVLMMADAVEAASRSLKEHTEKNIYAIVESIINNQVEQNQFINSNISFGDITRIKKIFKKMLKSIYHVRVSYQV